MKTINKIVLYIIGVALVFSYFNTAINSHGFYHADEHYQVLEFAGAKLGFTDFESLPWEYKAKLRSGLQPFVAWCFIKGMEGVNISDPYMQTFVLRLFSMFLALCSVFCLFKLLKGYLKHEYSKLFFALASLMLWFLPQQYVRFSSENLSIAVFIIGITVLFHSKKSNLLKYMFSGVLLGLSFGLRFHAGLLILALFLWLLIIHREKILNLVYLIAGLLFAFMLIIAVDFWLYNEFTFSALNYLKAALFNESPIKFSKDPWTFYVKKIVFGSFAFNGILIALASAFFVLKKPKHIVTWLVIPFLIVHFIFSHKEIRFLFPLMPFIPFLMAFLLDKIVELKLGVLFKKAIYILFSCILVMNLIIQLCVSFLPARSGLYGAFHYIESAYLPQNSKIYTGSLFGIGYPPFYSSKSSFNVEKYNRDSVCSIIDKKDVLYVTKKRDIISNNGLKDITELNGKLVYRSIPEWMQKLSPKSLLNEGEIFYVYKLYGGAHSYVADTVLFCNAEDLTEDKNRFIVNNKKTLSGGFQQTSVDSYSLNHSLLTSAKKPFGFDVKLKQLRSGDVYRVSVMKKGLEKNSLVVSASNTADFYLSNRNAETVGKDDWVKIESWFIIPNIINFESLKVYVWNHSGDTCFYDDLCVEKVRVID